MNRIVKVAQFTLTRPSNTLRWRGILFEIRTLLHEPLRYHPNIVRLLEIGWDASETGSAFPALYLEFAEFGTLDTLQQSKPTRLPFRIKQKLCYDVGRGLSIVHACGIVHGDLKHENVLIFRNQYDYVPDQPYTAKLADFGGAVMDTTLADHYILPMGTVPFEAPESSQSLTAEGIKKTDVYSFGLLIWRCFVDCADLLVHMRVRTADGPAQLTDAELERVRALKASDQLNDLASESVMNYVNSYALAQEISPLMRSILGCTMRQDPTARSLDKAQALLRGIQLSAVGDYLSVKDLANQRRRAIEDGGAPGTHGLTLDSLGFHLGRLGDDYDAQNNIPGYRSELQQPPDEGFLFEPLKLKDILGWVQQVEILTELEGLARKAHVRGKVELSPFIAAFFLFQAHLTEFGTSMKAFEACQWLYKASLPPEEFAGVDYLSKAWLSRVCAAFGVPDPRTTNDQIDDLFWSIIRGHRNCVADAEIVIASLPSQTEKGEAGQKINQAKWLFRTMTGGVGMPHYAPRKLRRPYDLQDLAELDSLIKLELGDDYDKSLREQDGGTQATPDLGGQNSDEKPRFDSIYVNHRGHGLLHMAATQGALTALAHIYTKYKCSIDLSNKSVDESPLLCACRSGHYDCAKFLLENGANPDGTQFGVEAPLHWLSSFGKEHMVSICRLLVQKGADREKITLTMRKDVRQIFADWEDTFAIPVTPLGRAVLLQNIDAVEVLLNAADAEPTYFASVNKPRMTSAVELAAVLTLPDILEVLLHRVDEKRGQDSSYVPHIYDECEMLEAAHDMRHTKSFDPLRLQSRVIRCGVNYNSWLVRTMKCLYARRTSHPSEPDSMTSSAKALCREVALGNRDILEVLLDLGHDPNGAGSQRPLESAVLANNTELFDLLVRRGASLSPELAGTLLIQCASRPQSSPPGTAIAERLIAAGADIEPTPHSSHPSAFPLAVKNRYFDLADFFVNYGAGSSLSQCFRWTGNDDGEQPMTLLGHLVHNHTYASLQSLEYLVQKHKDNECGVHLRPGVCDDSTGMTALHAIAASDPKAWNNHSQVSARILQLILDIFPTADSFTETGGSLMSAKYGTPLTAAIQSMNEPVISALLESTLRKDLWNVNNDVQSTPVANSSMADEENGATPVTALGPIQSIYHKVLATCDAMIASENLTPREVRVTMTPLFQVMQQLNTAYTAIGNAALSDSHGPIPPITDLRARLAAVIEHAKLTRQLQSTHLSPQSSTNLPAIADLSVLSEEKPTDWVEGTDMDEEAATRTMLKYMRTGGLANPIDKFMDQTYNKRAEGIRPMEPAQTQTQGDGEGQAEGN